MSVASANSVKRRIRNILLFGGCLGLAWNVATAESSDAQEEEQEPGEPRSEEFEADPPPAEEQEAEAREESETEWRCWGP